VKFGFDEFEAEIEQQLRENPVLVERIGELHEFEIDWRRSFAEVGEEVFVFKVEGSRGTGWVRLGSETLENDREEIHWGKLELPSGETVDLFPAAESPAGEPQEGESR